MVINIKCVVCWVNTSQSLLIACLFRHLISQTRYDLVVELCEMVVEVASNINTK